MADTEANGTSVIKSPVKVESPVKLVEKVVKSDSTPASKNELDIIRQIEYYFGDANLARDKFLQGEIEKDEGWVPLTVLLTFKRLSQMSEDAKVIAAALQKSDEGLVEVSEDQTKMRRHPERPLPEQNEEHRKEVMSRTVYLKGFPTETEMSDLIEFMLPYEPANIVLRKYHDKPTKTYIFKGSVFITFATKEQSEKVLAEELKYKDTVLIKKSQEAYMEEKKEERIVKDKKRGKNKKEETASFELPKNAVLFLEGFGEETTRENIKTSLAEFGGDIAFVDFSKGDKKGYVRYSAENIGKEVVAKLTDGKFKVDEAEITVRLVEGDEETEFLKKVIENMKSRRSNTNRGRRGGGGGRHFNNRKRRSSFGESGPPAKK